MGFRLGALNGLGKLHPEVQVEGSQLMVTADRYFAVLVASSLGRVR